MRSCSGGGSGGPGSLPEASPSSSASFPILVIMASARLLRSNVCFRSSGLASGGSCRLDCNISESGGAFASLSGSGGACSSVSADRSPARETPPGRLLSVSPMAPSSPLGAAPLASERASASWLSAAPTLCSSLWLLRQAADGLGRRCVLRGALRRCCRASSVSELHLRQETRAGCTRSAVACAWHTAQGLLRLESAMCSITGGWDTGCTAQRSAKHESCANSKATFLPTTENIFNANYCIKRTLCKAACCMCCIPADVIRGTAGTCG